MERCNVGRQEKAHVHIRIYPIRILPLGLYVEQSAERRHKARLRPGAVGLKSVTGGQNLEVGSRRTAESCDHTRQTLNEESRIAENKAGGNYTRAVHTVLCAGKTKRHS